MLRSGRTPRVPVEPGVFTTGDSDEETLSWQHLIRTVLSNHKIRCPIAGVEAQFAIKLDGVTDVESVESAVAERLEAIDAAFAAVPAAAEERIESRRVLKAIHDDRKSKADDCSELSGSNDRP